MSELERPYVRRCRTLAEAGRLRELPPSNTLIPLIDFSHNDYLGLARRSELIQAACAAAERWGVGATGARLLSGNSTLHESLEARIATDKGCEAALHFSTGFQANTSVLSALLDATTLGGPAQVFTDRLVHASMHEGFHTAGVREHRFHHNDLAHLEALLRRHRVSGRTAFLVAETVYGMDGDRADVAGLLTLARTYDAFLYLDEAHATGLFGSRGYGLACELPADCDAVVMGTFSKALGTAGAYVACSATIRDYLVNRCSGFLYSTAAPPPIVAAADAAWRLVPTLPTERAHVQALAERLRTRLHAAGYETGTSDTQIIPISVGDDHHVVTIRQRLRAEGISVAAIRPPTVPPKGARIRVSVAATHDDAQLEVFLDALTRASK